MLDWVLETNMQQCVIAVAMRDCSNSQMVFEINMQQCVIAAAMRDCTISQKMRPNA